MSSNFGQAVDIVIIESESRSLIFPSSSSPHRAALNRRFAEWLLAHEISRYPEVVRRGLVPMEAYVRSLVARPRFFHRLQSRCPHFLQPSFFFCANQSERIHVKFDGFHAALESAAY
jgi:hypothetical protein